MSIRFKHLAGVGTALAFLLLGQPVAAAQCDHNACPSECGEWEVGAHALYFTSITCPYAYATTFTTVQADTNGRAQIIPCRPDWGFRVFGNYLNDCLFAALSYQWFEVTTTRSVVTADNLRIQGGGNIGPGKATGQVGIEYQNVDVDRKSVV